MNEKRSPAGNSRRPLLIVAWAWVGVPFAYGVFQLAQTVTKLFGG
ncbi:MFS transporter small subunit [Amycolatopsis antarctica]|nr:hypothetical protein [Amycolatopsis antarctica]